jgi:hypothetical protein
MDYSLTISGNVLYINLSGYLTTNREYLITIDPYVSGLIPPDGTVDVLDSTYQFWFTSTYCPIFTTLGRVKLLAGPEADGLLDDTIYRMIHKNSLDVVDIYNLSYSSKYSYDYWGCDWQDVPFNMKRYVECKTAYDVINFVRISGGGPPTGGDQTKTLGDMTIKYGGSNTNSTGTPPKSKLQELYDCYMESLRMLKNMQAAVRGYYDTSKGFSHPVREPQYNRVVRPVRVNNISATGPWRRGYDWAAWRSHR